MNKDELLGISYHKTEQRRHTQAEGKIRRSRHDQDPVQLGEGATMVDRYKELCGRIEPFSTIHFNSRTDDREMKRTPLIPIKGVVEGEEVTFSLHFQMDLDGSSIYAYAAAFPFDDQNLNNLTHHEDVTLSIVELCDKNGRRDWRPLDDLEETVELYTQTLEAMTPEELEALNDLSAPVQLSLAD